MLPSLLLLCRWPTSMTPSWRNDCRDCRTLPLPAQPAAQEAHRRTERGVVSGWGIRPRAPPGDRGSQPGLVTEVPAGCLVVQDRCFGSRLSLAQPLLPPVGIDLRAVVIVVTVTRPGLDEHHAPVAGGGPHRRRSARPCGSWTASRRGRPTVPIRRRRSRCRA